MEESRVQFERKVGHAYGEDYLSKDEEGDYTNWLISDLWDIWQASRAAIEMDINKLQLENEEIECVHLCLDDAGTPRKEGEEVLSLWGRVLRYAAGLKIKGE